MASPIRLNLLPYLQSWDGTNLAVRLLALPRGDPLDDPLVEGQTPPGPSFASANLVFDVRLVKGLDQMVTTASQASNVIVEPNPTPKAKALFKALTNQFQIDPSPPPVPPRTADNQIKKYLPPTYQKAVGFSGSRTPFAVIDNSYFCAIRAPKKQYNKLKPQDPKLPWGKVIALAMRQPIIAEELGLIRPLQIKPPAADFFKEGGWLYVTLASSSDAFALTAIPQALKIYAARVPPLDKVRSLFTPVLFPVADVPPSGPYDELFLEAEEYDDGFAKAVHAAQPEFMNLFSEKNEGSRPVKDIGIRLGWDDEQVTIWLNRQIDPASAALDAPMCVFGYRVDAREAGESYWYSLCRAKGPVKVKNVSLKDFDGELPVEVIPTQLDGETVGTYWLPIYYTSWTGPSLAALDIVAQRLAGAPDPTDPKRVQGIAPEVQLPNGETKKLQLRYGKTYEFRVRLADHTGGGPEIEENQENPSPQPIATIQFKRWIRPRTARLMEQLPAIPDPSNPPAQIRIKRPLLEYPACVFADAPDAIDNLLADLPQARSEGREVALPDPDVNDLKISVQVEALGLDTKPGGGTDAGYHTIYETTRPYPPDAADPIVLDLDWMDVKDADSLTPGNNKGPLRVPTARNVRLVFTSVAPEDPSYSYFGADDVRFGQPVYVSLRHNSSDEKGLFKSDAQANLIKGIFLQPDTYVDAAVAFVQKATGKGVEAPGNAIGRLAEVLGLQFMDLTLRGRLGQRIVLGCSNNLRQILAPDASSITFASNGDLALHWIIPIQLTLDRDWTWDGLAPEGIAVIRDGQEVGHIELRRTVNEDALLNPQRNQTNLIFFDAIDPKPKAGEFPSEIELSYKLIPSFVAPPAKKDKSLELSLHLPITTPPSQIPRLSSAGIALSPYKPSKDYSSTGQRSRALWFEFESPVENPNDNYFVRVLSYSIDPLLIKGIYELPEAPEPPLPIDSEPIRVIVPKQSDDYAGLNAMQRLIPSDSPRHFMVPLPPGLHEDSNELFGFFTYEIRVGHDRNKGWSTAQGRFGAALRVTGVQHPAPNLTCLAARDSKGIAVSAPFANPVYKGRSLRPASPATEIWVLLYAQVVQADGEARRNVLVGNKRAMPFESARKEYTSHGKATWSNDEVAFILEMLTLRQDTPLSCLAVETLPGGEPLPDPLGANLGYQRFLRTSSLVPIPSICRPKLGT